MPDLHIDRRSAMKVVGAGLAAGAVGTGAAGASGGSLRGQLAQAESATKQYSDPAAAVEDGFVVLGPYVPGMGWHFLHPERVKDAVANGLDVREPQLLTYDDDGGDLTLASVEYGIPVGARGYDEENPPDLFDDEEADADEHWHVHPQAEHVFAIPPPPEGEELPTPEDLGLDDQLHTTRWVEVVRGGEPEPHFEPGMTVVTDFADGALLDPRVVALEPQVHPDLWTLHAWVHEENPEGVFAETNPTLANDPRP